MTTAKKGVVFIMGPTASGKTDAAVSLVQKLPADIISVDSALVYRGLNIGAAKPDAQTLAKAPHRLIDIRDPAEVYSAADFCQDATAEIERSHSQNRLPLLVGGTSMYFNSLDKGLCPLPSADAKLRAELEQEAEQHGWATLHQRLQAIDPTSAQKIHPNDAQRIQRALEIYALTGQTRTELYARQQQAKPPWPVLKIAIAPADRAVLHERIARRFKQMMDEGFYQEVEKLAQRPDLNSELPAIRAVGYRQLWQVIHGEKTLEEGIERAIIASRQLAKRQLTWLRRDRDVHWFASGASDLHQQVYRFVRQWYAHADA